MKTLLKRKFKPEPNDYLGGKPIYLNMAHSIEDLVIICGRCDLRMTLQGEDLVCGGCGCRDNGDDAFDEISIVGPLVGHESIYYPEDMEMPA